tara:strand:+ start:84 stop:683 length:600 start_codon:yes stop_codon:yes gene_type:complete
MATPDIILEHPTAQRAERINLPENGSFQFWVDVDRVRWEQGVCYFNPISVAIVPGIQNVPSDGDPATLDSYNGRKLKRVPVPMDFKVKAWGKVETGYVRRMSLGKDRRGKEMFHFHSVWEKHIQHGRNLRTEFDADGFQDFRERVNKLMGGPPVDFAADAEAARVRGVATELRRMRHASPGAGGIADDLLAPLTAAPAA